MISFLGIQGLLLFSRAKSWASSRLPLSDYQPSLSSATSDNKEHFVPVGDFSAVSDFDYTHLAHPLFPHHGVRIKKTDFCDPSVNSYTGYIDNQDRHLFFYFFESRNDPKSDDVIYWTNGGPGRSSALGIFMELGPCRISDDSGPKYFPHSWSNNANVISVEQPVGTGYSYSENGESVSTSESAAIDIAAFVAIFFENFDQFKGRKFHMAGGSYGGRYIPLFASAVYDQNAKLVEAGWSPINLASVIIGNGGTELRTVILSYYDMLCTPASFPPFIDIASCIRMKQVLPRCSRWLKEACTDTFDAINCKGATDFCKSELSTALYKSGRSPYDLSKKCQGDTHDTWCYPVSQTIANYLNSSSTRALLKIPPILSSRPYTQRSDKVFHDFVNSGDNLYSSDMYVAALLERGVKVLIYAGTYDWMFNWVGNERWTLDLDWSGREKFSREPLRVWNVTVSDREKRAGRVRSKGGLTFATVEGGGQMVPYDKPQEVLAMINRWLAGVHL